MPTALYDIKERIEKSLYAWICENDKYQSLFCCSQGRAVPVGTSAWTILYQKQWDYVYSIYILKICFEYFLFYLSYCKHMYNRVKGKYFACLFIKPSISKKSWVTDAMDNVVNINIQQQRVQMGSLWYTRNHIWKKGWQSASKKSKLAFRKIILTTGNVALEFDRILSHRREINLRKTISGLFYEWLNN